MSEKAVVVAVVLGLLAGIGIVRGWKKVMDVLEEAEREAFPVPR